MELIIDEVNLNDDDIYQQFGQVLCIEEKPDVSKSNYAVTGLYIYDNGVFDVIKTLKPSEQGEIEIMYVNNEYIGQGNMGYSVLDVDWSDEGTFESLLNGAKST